MKKLCTILAIMFIASIAYGEISEAKEASEPTNIETEPIEWFNGVRGFIGLSGGYIGGTFQPDDRNNSQTLSDKSYKFFTSSFQFKNAFNSIFIEQSEITPMKGYNFNILFGTEIFFIDNYLGLRLEAGVGYSDLSSKQNMNKTLYATDFYSSINAFLGLDLIGNIYVGENYSIGLFAGGELDYFYMLKFKRVIAKNKQEFDFTELNSKLRTINLSMRFGISVLLYQHHRIEFITKLPAAYIALRPSDTSFQDLPLFEKVSIGGAYKYVF